MFFCLSFPSSPLLEPADFETAIAATGYGKFNFLLLLVALPCCMCTVFETTTISYVLPSAECDLHLSLVDKGTLNAVTYGGRYKYLRTHFSATAAPTTVVDQVPGCTALTAFALHVVQLGMMAGSRAPIRATIGQVSSVRRPCPLLSILSVKWENATVPGKEIV